MKLQEGWLTYYRVLCKEGMIDWCMTYHDPDMSNSPEPKQHVNLTRQYFRLNGGNWHESGYFENIRLLLNIFANSETAKDIWNLCLKEDKSTIKQ
jgi:hypothetical protein